MPCRRLAGLQAVLLEQVPELGQIARYDIPSHGTVNLTIAMRHKVSEASHLTPGKTGVQVHQGIR